jgi:glycerol-3-phosphate dehydrogenase
MIADFQAARSLRTWLPMGENRSTMDRAKNLGRVESRPGPWDVVVIGGGATGAGCALDAAARGLDVLLLEQHDFGKGTSSRSTKLIHGGVRYLGQGDISLVRESLRERAHLLKNAPHVVRRQEFVVPCYSRWQTLYYAAGLKIYDLLAGSAGIGRSRAVSRDETLEKLPTARSAGLVGGVSYFDGQFDDARLLIDLVSTAEEQGATVLNYARVSAVGAAADLPTVSFTDEFTSRSFEITARAVINATGAFCDDVRRMAAPTPADMVTLSQGVHVVLDRSFLPGDAALMLPKTSDGRVLFAIPWLGYTLVGTTDTPIERAELEPRPLESEIEFLLQTVAASLAKVPTRSDVKSVFAGVRPLVSSAAARNTASLSRSHSIELYGRMITITGGKWTTYRSMAEETVDAAVRVAALDAGPSKTWDLPITGVPGSGRSHEPLYTGLPYTVEDVERAVRYEMVQTVEDVLARRTRCLFLDAAVAIELAPVVAEIMAKELGKNADWVAREIEEFEKVASGYMISSDA